jgi:nucleoside-diphosphate-sugar epimerase
MKRVVVTGGAGRLGRCVIGDLLQRDYEVTAVDILPAEGLECPFEQLDVSASDDVGSLLEGQDAVLHLGAVNGPQMASGPTTFRNNVMSTYNIVHAAAEQGLSKVVFASSLFTVGWAEDPSCYWPQYVPMDEEHPLTPYEEYGLSKVIGEEICAACSRATGMPTVSLRITNVIQPDKQAEIPWPAPTVSEPVRFTLWPYVTLQDAADACRLALEAETTGHEAFFIAARDIRFNAPTRELLQTFAPQVEIRGELVGTASVLSIEKARRVLGYEPKENWPEM